jgi:hypothetical protein
VLNEIVTSVIRSCSGRPCFRIYGRASYEADWRVIDIFATHRRDYSSRWPLWRAACITWTSSVIAVGWEFAALVMREQSAEPMSRDRPITVAGGRLNDGRRRSRTGASSQPSAGEILAHECGHTGQANRWGALYWPVGGAFTLFREGTHWWNRFENQASETGQFGGIVSGSVWMERFAPGP